MFLFAIVFIDLPNSLIQKYTEVDAGTIVVTAKVPGGQNVIQPFGKKKPRCRFKEECPTIAANYDDDEVVNFTNHFFQSTQLSFIFYRWIQLCHYVSEWMVVRIK